MYQKMNNIGLGSHGHVQKSRNHKNEGFSVFTIALDGGTRPDKRQPLVFKMLCENPLGKPS